MGSGRGWLAGDWPSTGGALSTFVLRRPGLRVSADGVLATKSERKILASICLYSLYAWLLLLSLDISFLLHVGLLEKTKLDLVLMFLNRSTEHKQVTHVMRENAGMPRIFHHDLSRKPSNLLIGFL